MGYKGYHVLKNTVPTYTNLISDIVIARDPNIDNDYHAEIIELCEQLNIKWRERQDKSDIQSDFAIAISWRWLIDLPPEKLIIFHDSLLPKYRGFNPLVSYLINGETTLGVSAIFGASEYDRGHIIAQAHVDIDYPIKIKQAIELVTRRYQELAQDILAMIASGQPLTGKPQDESKASYSLWRDDEDYRIPWNNSAEWIARFIDAIGPPYKGALTLLNGQPARILEAEPLPDVHIENRTPGKVIWMHDIHPIVTCGEGLLEIKDLVDVENTQSFLPLKQFRSRFT